MRSAVEGKVNVLKTGSLPLYFGYFQCIGILYLPCGRLGRCFVTR